MDAKLPHEDRLLRLWAENEDDFRGAFVRWLDGMQMLSELRELEEAKGRVEWGEDHVDEVPASVVEEVVAAYAQLKGAALTGGQRCNAERRVFAPLTSISGLSVRRIAELTGLSLADVVGAVYHPACRKKAEGYAELEEEILRGILQTRAVKSLQRQYGISPQWIHKVCVRHKIANPSVKERA